MRGASRPGARAYALLAAVAGASLAMTAPTMASPANPPLDHEQVRSFLEAEIPEILDEFEIPGAIVSVVGGGGVRISAGFGLADVADDRRATAESIFNVGSVSKLILWTAVMQLVEQGRIDLDADVNDYLTTFRVPDTHEEPITMANLLTHTAGFEDRWTGVQARTAADLVPLGDFLEDAIPDRVWRPGEVTAYSNYGAALAGYIVEQVSGESFADYVEQRVFEPLGMTNSTFRQPVPTSSAPQLARSYVRDGAGFDAMDHPLYQVAPAGALSTTASDMGRFMAAHLGGGQLEERRILTEATTTDMHEQHFTNDERLPGMTWGFAEAELNGRRVIRHVGEAPAFKALVALVPDAHLGVFAAFNGDNGGRANDALLARFLDRFAPGEPKSSDAVDGTGSDVTGAYAPTRRNVSNYEKLGLLTSIVTVDDRGDGRLTLDMHGTLDLDAVELQRTGPDVYQQVDGQEVGTVVFRPSGVDGEMTMMLGNLPMRAYTQAGWSDRPMINVIALVIALLVFSTFLVVQTPRAVRRLRRSSGIAEPVVGVDLERNTHWIAVAIAVAYIAGTILIGLAVPGIVYGKPATLTMGSLLITVAAALTAVGLVLAVILWARHVGTRWWRTLYTLVIAVGIVVALQASHWNLLAA